MEKERPRALTSRLLPVLYTAVAVALVWLLAYVGARSQLPGMKLSAPAPHTLSSGWRLVRDGDSWPAALPLEVDGDEVLLKIELPQLKAGDMLLFPSRFQKVQVSVEGQVLLDYGYSQPAPLGALLGDVLCQVPLAPGHSGHTLTLRLELDGRYPNRAGLAEMYLDQQGTLYSYLLQKELPKILCISIFLLVGVALCAGYVLQLCKKAVSSYKNLLYLGCFVLLAAVWVWSDSSLGQLAFSNSVGVCLVSFFSFMLLPAPLLGMVGTTCPSAKRYTHLLQDLILGNILVQTALYLFNVVDYPVLLPVTHLLLLFSAGYMTWLLVRQVRRQRSPYARDMLLALGFLGASALVSLAMFYIDLSLDKSTVFCLGLMVFILILCYSSVRWLFTLQGSHTEMVLYRKLAYTDVMTHTQNRIAFETFLEERRAGGPDQPPLEVYMFDLNGLKSVNDEQGHQAGDQVIRDAADIIRAVLGGLGTLYRIGGDEFVAILQDARHPRSHYARLLQKAVADHNRQLPQPAFTIAMGSASSRTFPQLTIDQLLEIADRQMYRDKARQKAGQPLESR